jgi:hypothetical protein
LQRTQDRFVDQHRPHEGDAAMHDAMTDDCDAPLLRCATRHAAQHLAYALRMVLPTDTQALDQPRQHGHQRIALTRKQRVLDRRRTCVDRQRAVNGDGSHLRRCAGDGTRPELLGFSFARAVKSAKPWAGARQRATAAVGAKGAPTALRCSGFGRTV